MSRIKKTPEQALAEDVAVTVEDCAVLLGLSRNGTYNAVRSGTIPSIAIGRTIRVPSAALRRMLDMGVDVKQIVASANSKPTTPDGVLTELIAIDAELHQLGRRVRKLLRRVRAI